MVALLLITGNSPSVFSGQVDFCKLFGAVYVEENPRLADFRVFEEESEAFCDIKVFEVEDRLYADRQGLWHFTKKKEFADFTVYFEPNRGLADFSVYFIDVESFAGCNK
jgi:hypothetical protein